VICFVVAIKSFSIRIASTFFTQRFFSEILDDRFVIILYAISWNKTGRIPLGKHEFFRRATDGGSGKSVARAEAGLLRSGHEKKAVASSAFHV
jgi:hypothetical protein